MPSKLSTTVAKIGTSIPNKANADLVREFHQHMRERDTSERHQNNALKVLIPYAIWLGKDTNFLSVNRKDQILSFLDTKIKSPEVDPDRRWITTWNHTMHRIQAFYRYLHNQHGKSFAVEMSDWNTPDFAKIKEKKTKRLSPYSETEIWSLDELLAIVKYAQEARDKCALTMIWDFDARPSEATMLRLKRLRFHEQYAEGSVEDECKTGTGPILLTVSFRYLIAWLNEHPFKDNPEARVLYNLRDGSPLRPDVMWQLMQRLKGRIVRLLEKGEISDPAEREKLQYLLKTKKWSPYCIRHSAITADAYTLPEFAVRLRARWSMDSDRPKIYIKKLMTDGLKQQLLQRAGIQITSQTSKPTVRICNRCDTVCTLEQKFCTKCSFALVPEAVTELKAKEAESISAHVAELKKQLDALTKAYLKAGGQVYEMIEVKKDKNKAG